MNSTLTSLANSLQVTNVLHNYDMLSGTSMAAPHVTGVVALIISQNPDLGYQEVIKIVLATVDRVPSVVVIHFHFFSDGNVGIKLPFRLRRFVHRE